MEETATIALDGSALSLDQVYAISKGASVTISPDVKDRVRRCHQYVHQVAESDRLIYGINTGFGYLANKRISCEQLKRLQRNILISHASGYGQPLGVPETRVAMALRLNVLLMGVTGVSLELCQALCDHLTKGITPIIPEFGSVGASGDLAPLAHLALPLIGEGMVFYQGEAMEATDALQRVGLRPIVLAEKEGLGLINGTQVMLAVGALALIEARELIRKSHLITALSYEAMKASLAPLHPNLNAARGHVGQMIVAHEILKQLEGSHLYGESFETLRVQDAYSLRCVPQVHGASLDGINYAIQVVETELGGATDNPLIFAEEELILSGGNFHGQPLALGFDMASMALSEMGNISDRRIELMLNPHMSHLPAFLSPNEGICSGYMAAQYLTASLVNECKLLSNPACTDSIPGNVGIEDHVSMGMTSARKMAKIVKHASVILSAEMVIACQAIDLRQCAPLGRGTKEVYDLLREYVPVLNDDRVIAEDVYRATEVFEKI